MKATGIVRRIDELGRVVIPKEIRRAMGLTDGMPLEIFTEGDKIIFRRYRNYQEIDWDKLKKLISITIGNKAKYTIFDYENPILSNSNNEEFQFGMRIASLDLNVRSDKQEAVITIADLIEAFIEE